MCILSKDFFTKSEAEHIIQAGNSSFERSPVDSGGAEEGDYSDDRTSYTAFLNDTSVTRDFRHRTAHLARLPAASFVERLQLVRYKVGQFFRRHEDYFESKNFLPKADVAMKEYNDWARYMADKLSAAESQGQVDSRFLPGGSLFPDTSKNSFEIEMLKVFLKSCEQNNFFENHADSSWGMWIKENVRINGQGIIQQLAEDRTYMVKHILRSWEAELGLPNYVYE